MKIMSFSMKLKTFHVKITNAHENLENVNFVVPSYISTVYIYQITLLNALPIICTSPLFINIIS